MIKVIKRDCTEVEFQKEKISNAILKAMKNGSGIVKPKIAEDIAEEIYEELKNNEEISISEIEKKVFDKLISKKQRLTAKAYEGYRSIREFQRDNENTTDEQIMELLKGESTYWNEENSNKNPVLANVQRDYLAGILSTDITRRYLLSPEIVQAHDEGLIHFHDADYFAQDAIHNCELINAEDILQNGTVINGVTIDKPHRIITASTILTQVITAVTSSSYGGATINLAHLAPFVRDSYNLLLNKYRRRNHSEEDCVKYAKEDLAKEVEDAVQTFNYQCNSMTNTNGQAPFLSVFMYLNDTEEYKEELAMLIEEFLKQRIQGLKNEVGVYVTQAFPKLLYVLEKDNITEDSPYWYLTELAAKCTAKRLVPDYISEKIMLESKIDKNGNGNCYGCMGCRSFLTPYVDPKTNKPKYWGRFNQGVVTINLPDVAFSSEGDFDKFWEIFEERTELCHKALRCRHERLKGTKSDVAPILWQHGALARLEKGQVIDELLYGGYSTISLGYAGLYECVKYMTGYIHTDGSVGEEFGLKVMQALNDKCNQWKLAENMDYSLYGTPMESGTYKFAQSLKRRFGDDIFIKMDGEDRDYITNSYHIAVFEEINPFEKLAIESKFQRLSPGGAISYIETADMQKNIPAVLEVLKFIYDNIMYAELNTKSDYCQVCGYDGEIKIVDEDNKLIWECPNCKNRDKSKMNVARRTCGYIGTQFWNQGRTDEILHRYVHMDDHEAREGV